MIDQTLWYSTALASHLKSLDFKDADKKGNVAKTLKRIDPRTRDDKYEKALSFEVFDPLWMLSRQWQYGRFKAVDCGIPVMVKVRTKRMPIDKIQFKDSDEKTVDQSYFTDRPLEYDVEKRNYKITPYVRVQSAMQLKKMLLASGLKKNDFAFLYDEKYKLKDEIEEAKIAEQEGNINALKTLKNSDLIDFYKFYRNRSFDGYKVYKNALTSQIAFDSENKETLFEVFSKYVKWFEDKFLPCGENDDRSSWNEKKLGYDVTIKQGNNTYFADDYDFGKLSWYSFDCSAEKSDEEKKPFKMLSYIPTPAKIPGAPASRLWEFEDRKVNMGNCGNDYSFIGTAAIMQYVSMFSNDWMIMPLETETGTVLDVVDIVVKDSFGDRFYIGQNAQKIDECDYNKGKKDDDPEYSEVAYTDRWNLFGSSFANAYAKQNFSTHDGLLFPPTVLRCEESAPIEEVQFLRDEMANMVWGVETKFDNGCGGTMDGRMLSEGVLEAVDELNLRLANPESETQNEEDEAQESQKANNSAAYSLLIQNRVPINWIPFIPEQIPGDCRNIALRRAKVPVYYNRNYCKIDPSTDLLACKKLDDNRVKPMYINEEEVTGCGIKIVKTAQRTRWFLGKSYNWVGNRQIISGYQANSGLMFDELISKATGKAIVTPKEIESSTQEDDGTKQEGEVLS
ncbi:hypothetical protein [Fibrobacter sp. UWB12]|uniref:hypothetical protein n=1 Tax=Fibrobacter sp. UWB12 TaxID=1896203 RepID=UPI00091D4819|nr:hypothetical protein [Fibrobacter sp. UWB12]SHK60932.1 hypothetical protein SAMN05720759_104170 [Fibrobacter sp. UWB12]